MADAAGTVRSGRKRIGNRAGLWACVGLCALAGAQPAWSLAQFERKLIPSTAVLGDYAGSAVAVSGDTVLLGSPYHNLNDVESGAVWVFTRVPGTTFWSEQAKLTPTDGAEGDAFGWSVAISGDTAAIGAPGRKCGPTGGIYGCGAVYVFERNGSSWSEGPMLVGMAGSFEGAWFGASVALREHWMVVGSPDSPPASTGSADVFVRGVNIGWQHDAHLSSTDGANNDRFGWSVGIDFSGDRSRVQVVVGCVYHDKAYVFETAGVGLWPQVDKLVRDDPPLLQGFGRSVAISGETILVGAWSPAPGPAGSGAGATYVFTRSDATGLWPKEDKLLPSDPRFGLQNVGYSVALSGDTAVVGAPGLGGGTSGTYVYQRGTGGWTETDKLLSPEVWTNYGQYGRVVAIDGETAVIAAPKDTPLRGAGYVYTIPAPEPSSWLLQTAALATLAMRARPRKHRPQAA